MKLKTSQKLAISQKMKLLTTSFFCILPLAGFTAPNLPEDMSIQTPASIEKLKTDIVQLNAEFRNLEQEYLYPAAVDAALFVSVDTGQYFQLEAIEARIDDQPVVGHFYTEKQREALTKGGIQRLRQFHLKPGEHQLVITIIGQNSEGETIKRGITHQFTKTAASIGLELKLIDSEKSLSVAPEIKTWKL
jgi:hypothetical protein